MPTTRSGLARVDEALADERFGAPRGRAGPVRWLPSRLGIALLLYGLVWETDR